MSESRFTRCPGCMTLFRVTRQQLALREGQVRCGQCRAVFDANDHLVEPPYGAEETAPERAVEEPSEPRLERAPEAVEAVAETSRESATDTASKETAEAGGRDAAAAPSERAAVRDAAAEEARSDAQAFDATEERSEAVADEGPIASDARVAEPTPAAIAEPAPDADSQAATDADTEAATDADTEAATDADTEAAGEADTDAEAAAEARTEPATDAAQAPAMEPGPAGADVLERAVRPEWRPRRSLRERPKALYGGAIALLGIALALQAVLEYRDSLAAHAPFLRPVLERACSALGCSIGPLQDTAALSIEASDLQADPAHRGLLLLTATIRNRAAYAIAYPHVELTLTDSSDQVVVRRAFPPADYIGGTTSAASGIPSNGEKLVKLFIDASATSQAGYRLYLFYP